MTITNTNRKITYTGNGSTTVFSYGFIIPTAADANVALYEIATGILAAPLDPSVYSITGLGNVAGGSVTYPLSGSPLASTHKIVIYRSVAFEQVTNLTNQSAYLPEVLEDQLDILVMMSQELSEEVSRGVKVTLGSGDDPDTLIATLTAQSAAATASASAASISETNAANSATAAAADAVSTAADVVSTNADVLLTAADVVSTSNDVTSTNADVVSTNADVVSTNADVATSGNSATAAAASETNAATSETNAATSATNAAASYDSFDDRYLGAKAADPTLDNDGNALLTGALYWNTGSNEMRVYSGSAWITAYLPSSDYLALAGGTMTGVLNMGGQNITKVNSAFLTEQAAADADVAGDGQLWVKNATPNELWFTDDAGGDKKVAFNSDTRRNRITNPCMQLSQENGDTAGATTNYYMADEWRMQFSTSAGVLSGQRIQSTTLAGALDRARISVTTADTSLAAGEYLTFINPIEGAKFADALWGTADAKDVVLRFMVNAPAGTYAIAITSSGHGISMVKEYTISTGGVDTIVELPIAGPTTGTWNTDNTTGPTLWFTFATGSTYQTTADAWQTGLFLGTSSTSNGLGAVQSFDIGDVGLRLDPDSAGVYGEFEVPDYAENERACMRYYQKLQGTPLVAVTTIAANYPSWLFPVRCRSAPAMSYAYNAGTGAIFSVYSHGFYQSGSHTVDSGFSYYASARM